MIRQVYETGLSAVFSAGTDEMMTTSQHCKHHCYRVGDHTIAALEWTPADRILRLAAFCMTWQSLRSRPPMSGDGTTLPARAGGRRDGPGFFAV